MEDGTRCCCTGEELYQGNADKAACSVVEGVRGAAVVGVCCAAAGQRGYSSCMEVFECAGVARGARPPLPEAAYVEPRAGDGDTTERGVRSSCRPPCSSRHGEAPRVGAARWLKQGERRASFC